ncbi:hypothetical protein [uncultured Modestobacter sp.]|uniref:hypothetical protein n=1 Tax=uncultured Modestobacter sp. TaxID=380048 RepID=UPI00262CE003|nr:hypothetical protein [uncultured Modestobacter sp.]
MSLAEAVLTLAQQAGGGPFPHSVVTDLGGWARIASDAASLTGQPVLPLVAALVAREAQPGDTDAAAAAEAIADAVVATTQPSLLRDSLDALLDSAVVTQAAGAKLVAGLEPIAAGFLARETPAFADLASADALEAMTRLVAAGHGSHFSLLALLQKFNAPTTAPMSRAVIRSVSTAIDVWPEADALVDVVRVLGGVDAVDGGDPALVADVESDAAWVLAMASLLRSLRAPSVQGMTPHLEDAARFFGVAANAHQRPDAAPMLGIVEALGELVKGVVSSDAMGAMATTPLSANALAVVRDQILRFRVDSSGLDHWYGDNKRAALSAWSALADDLERMGSQLGKDGFYQAEIVVRDLLAIYVSSRTFRVGTRGAEIVGVQDLIQPVIDDGFASNASHLSNLEEYASDLESQRGGDKDDEEATQLHAARSIIAMARRAARGVEAPGKAVRGVPPSTLPPLLGRLIPSGSIDEDLIAQISPDTLAAIEHQLDHVASGRSHLNLAQQELFDKLRAALSTSPDYKDEVVSAVDEVLLLIINFVASRTGSSAGHYGYLFDVAANEDAIHEDLYGYLVGNLGSRVEYEVSHVGGGRVDIRLKFSTFALHVEMKVDSTKLPMSDRTAYLKQAATYQGNDVRIGFLIALRHKAFDPTGPPPHIKSLIGHTAFDIEGDPEPRHIIHVAVPGSRTNPSNSK